MPAYHRVLLKLSGEAFGGGRLGVDPDVIARIAGELAQVARGGTEVAVVTGGGNFFRGAELEQRGFDRRRADYMGMLGTVMNALALEHAIEAAGAPARAMSAVPMPSLCESYARKRALDHLSNGKVVILGGGTGNPYFTTDTCASLRATELGCEIVLKATKVDGVYTADPRKDPTATRYETITFDEAFVKNLKVMDATALALCRDQRLPINVFSIFKEGALRRVVMGEPEGTLVHA